MVAGAQPHKTINHSNIIAMKPTLQNRLKKKPV